MRVENAIKPDVPGFGHSIATVKPGNIVKRPVLKQFRAVVDFLMHKTGLTQTSNK